MKKWIVGFVIIGIISILIVGCTTVGAVNLPVDIDESEKQIEDNSTNNVGNIDDNKTDGEEKPAEGQPDAETDTKEKDLDDNEEADTSDLSGDEDDDEKVDDEEIKIIESKIHYFGDSNKKLVSLTFDDGPELIYTQEILDILDEYNIKATFFVIGQNVEKYPDVLKEIHGRGHEIGNHTWSHKYLPKISNQTVENEVRMTEKAITDVLGGYSPLFRPPYGAIKKLGVEQINSLGYNVVNWSVDTRDWANTSSEQMMKYVQQQLTPGGIILMHNSGSPSSLHNTIELLPEMIEWIIEQGYEFCTVSEILDL